MVARHYYKAKSRGRVVFSILGLPAHWNRLLRDRSLGNIKLFYLSDGRYFLTLRNYYFRCIPL
jgi:hypothetical protein